MSTAVITENQERYIRSLATERSSHFPFGVDAFVTAIKDFRITRKDGVDAVIQELLRMPADPSPTGADTRPRNMYPGDCRLCRGYVPANSGVRVKLANRWAVEHLKGQCPEVVTTTIAAAPSKHRMTELVGDLPDGYYAVPSINGNNDLSFFRIATNKGMHSPAKKGQRYVRLVSGGDGNGSVVTYEWVAKAVALVRSVGANEARALYGQQIGSCGVCGRLLTDETSRRLGIGPTCRGGF